PRRASARDGPPSGEGAEGRRGDGGPGGGRRRRRTRVAGGAATLGALCSAHRGRLRALPALRRAARVSGDVESQREGARRDPGLARPPGRIPRLLIQRSRAAGDCFWFPRAGPPGLIAARALVAANTLWILLSRRDLPDVLDWPPEFWMSVSEPLKIRFLIFGLPSGVEHGLYALLHLALLTALVGLYPRLSCAVAGVLLYHFPPLDEILQYALGPYFGGTTLPVLALLVFAVARVPRAGMPASAEFAWPLRFVQVLFAFHYFWPGYAKLFHSGLRWMTGDNIRESLFLVSTFGPDPPRWAGFVASTPFLYWFIAL